MDEDKLTRQLNETLGTALHATVLISALYALLIRNAVISPSEAGEALDGALLLIERQRGLHVGSASGPGAVDHALYLLRHLQQVCSVVPLTKLSDDATPVADPGSPGPSS